MIRQMLHRLGLCLGIITLICSCNNTYRLTAHDYNLMPYATGESLVFRSDKQGADTIRVIKKDTLLAYPEAQIFNGTKYEVLSVTCASDVSNSDQINHSFKLFQVLKRGKNKVSFLFDLSLKNCEFYFLFPIDGDSIFNQPPQFLRTSSGTYRDVFLIPAKGYPNSFNDRYTFVKAIYWSKSKGLVAFQKKDDEFWQLTDRYTQKK